MESPHWKYRYCCDRFAWSQNVLDTPGVPDARKDQVNRALAVIFKKLEQNAEVLGGKPKKHTFLMHASGYAKKLKADLDFPQRLRKNILGNLTDLGVVAFKNGKKSDGTGENAKHSSAKCCVGSSGRWENAEFIHDNGNTCRRAWKGWIHGIYVLGYDSTNPTTIEKILTME